MKFTLVSRAALVAALSLAGGILPGCSDDASDHAGNHAPRADATSSANPAGASIPAETVEGLSQPAADGAGLSAEGAYLRQPAPGQKMLAAFVTFSNDSTQAYTLNHISSPRASAVEVHRTLYNDGVMSMRKVNHLVVSPKATIAFKPGGYHVMLSGVTGEFNPGDQIPLKFHFEEGVTLDVSAEVRAIH